MASTPTVASHDVAYFSDLVFAFSFSLYSLDPLSLSYTISYGVLSASWTRIFSAKVFNRFSAAILPSLTNALVSNGRMRTAFLDVQSQIFFDFSRLPAAEWKRNSVVGRHIFLPFLEKLRSVSIKTTVGASRDPNKEKAVTVSPRDLLPMDACAYVTWISLGVALLVSTARFGKSVQICLNFELAGLSDRMES